MKTLRSSLRNVFVIAVLGAAVCPAVYAHCQVGVLTQLGATATISESGRQLKRGSVCPGGTVGLNITTIPEQDQKSGTGCTPPMQWTDGVGISVTYDSWPAGSGGSGSGGGTVTAPLPPGVYSMTITVSSIGGLCAPIVLHESVQVQDDGCKLPAGACASDSCGDGPQCEGEFCPMGPQPDPRNGGMGRSGGGGGGAGSGSGGSIGGPGPQGGNEPDCKEGFTKGLTCSLAANQGVLVMKDPDCCSSCSSQCPPLISIKFTNNGSGTWTSSDPLASGWPNPTGDPTIHFPDGSQMATDSSGNTTIVTNPDGTKTTTTYNSNGQPATTTTPDGRTWTYNYTFNGVTDPTYEPDEVTSPTGEHVVWTYYNDLNTPDHLQNGLLRSKTIEDAQGNTITGETFSYDDSGNLMSVLGSNGLETNYSYTGNQVTEVAVQDSSYSYYSDTTYSYGTEQLDPGTGPENFSYTIVRRRATGGIDDNAKDEETKTDYYQDSTGTGTYPYSVTRYKSIGGAGVTTIDKRYGWLSYFSDSDKPTTDDSALQGLVWREVDPLGHATTYTYYSATNGDGGWSRQVASITYPTVGSVTPVESFWYFTDSSGNKRPWLYKQEDVRGKYFKHVYNDLGQITEEDVSPNDSSYTPLKQYTYYPSGDARQGMVETVTVPNIDGTNSDVTTFDYNEVINGVTKTRTSPTSVTKSWWNPALNSGQGGYQTVSAANQYDDSDRLLVATDEESKSVAYQYDALGRVTAMDDDYSGTFSATRTYHYSCCGMDRQSWLKDGTTYYTYYLTDELGRTTDVSIPTTGTSGPWAVKYVYDLFGNQTTVTSYKDSNDTTGRLTTYTYDALNRLSEATYPYSSTKGDLLATVDYTCDDDGNMTLKKETDSGGHVTQTAYEYDALNRQTGVDYGNDGTWDVTFTYDVGSSLLKTVSEANSLGTTSYDYDDQGRLKDYTPPIPSNYSVGPITYNNLDEKTSVPFNRPGGTQTTTYTYYEDGTLKNLTWPSPTIPVFQAAYQYYKDGLREQTILGNLGHGYYQTNYAYDSQNRITDIAHYHSAGAPWNGARIAEISYGTNLDEQGNPKQIDEYDDAGGGHHFVNTYSYDEWNRLLSWAYNGNTESWTYDWVGNWLTGPVSTDTYTTDPKVDELTATSTPNYTYNYDNRGSLTNANGTPATSYGYNKDELLDNVTTGTATSTMTWDNAGRRLQLNTSGGATWQFVYDPSTSNPAVLVELNGSSEVDYIREPDGSLVARDDPTASSYSYYLFDPVGSTIAMVPTVEGSPTDRFYYDPWGQIITSDPNGRQSTVGTADNPYRYVGQLGYYYHQQDSNLQSWMELGVRFYNPSLGRFERRDPLGNVLLAPAYAYASSRPETSVDPLGLTPRRKKTHPISDEIHNTCYDLNPLPGCSKRCYQCCGALMTNLASAVSVVVSTILPPGDVVVPSGSSTHCEAQCETQCHKIRSGSQSVRDFTKCLFGSNVSTAILGEIERLLVDSL